MNPTSTNAAIYAAIIAIRAASAALEASHAATMAVLKLKSKERENELDARIGALPNCVKHHLLTFVIPNLSLGPFSMTRGSSLTFIGQDLTVQDGIVRLEMTDKIPDPGRGAYILKSICFSLRNFAAIEFPRHDRGYEFDRVDRRERWTTPRVPTMSTPICFEWTRLAEGQDWYGWWVKIGCRLSLYNEDGRWTVQRLESIASHVNIGLHEAIRREEEHPYNEDPYDYICAFDDFIY